ncbi:hypothetical protein GGR56DRAFT_424120 [Xylariaceae sp. FL0804]|nr:hypothetical protein GGR56DRAFT_424120 [Xylariaceae sp. FL0804]
MMIQTRTYVPHHSRYHYTAISLDAATNVDITDIRTGILVNKNAYGIADLYSGRVVETRARVAIFGLHANVEPFKPTPMGAYLMSALPGACPDTIPFPTPWSWYRHSYLLPARRKPVTNTCVPPFPVSLCGDRDLLYFSMLADRTLLQYDMSHGFNPQLYGAAQRVAVLVWEDRPDPEGWERVLPFPLTAAPLLQELFVVHSSPKACLASAARLDRDEWGFVDFQQYVRAIWTDGNMGKDTLSNYYKGVSLARNAIREAWGYDRITIRRVVDVERSLLYPAGKLEKVEWPVRQFRHDNDVGGKSGGNNDNSNNNTSGNDDDDDHSTNGNVASETAHSDDHKSEC